jgi:hypothetical protein
LQDLQFFPDTYQPLAIDEGQGRPVVALLPRASDLNFRHGSAGVYHWEFDKGPKSHSVAVKGPLIVDDVEIIDTLRLSRCERQRVTSSARALERS